LYRDDDRIIRICSTRNVWNGKHEQRSKKNSESPTYGKDAGF
jgi:hypothetical protein